MQRLDDLPKMKFVHFVKPNEFDEIIEFRQLIEELYGIEVLIFEGNDFKREV